ncbi:MAG TPA: hypothetical protein VMY40_15650 [Anaerolineae bacterium]|nr:hypothetical protein [Anaerolineae bacterium]
MAAREFREQLHSVLPGRREDISSALDVVAAADDLLAEARSELEALAPLVDEARAARQWVAEAMRRRALAEVLDDLLKVQVELDTYIQFRKEHAAFVEDGQRLIRRAAGETRRAMPKIKGILERISRSGFEEERLATWQELPAIYDDLRPVHQELKSWHSELVSRFATAGLHRWEGSFWRVLIAGFPDLRDAHADADLGATNVDQQAALLKEYQRLIGWGIFLPPADVS